MNSHQTQIIRIIDSATNKIQVAVSWFTDETILNKLIERAEKIPIFILLSADEINLLRHKHFRTLIDLGATVNKLGSTSALDGNFMHSKFIIIDCQVAYGGSYNFTTNARSNFETFKKWDISELYQTKADYDHWINKSIGFFDDIKDVEEIVNKIKEKFVRDESRKNQLLKDLGNIQFSEHDYITKREQELNQIKLSATTIEKRKSKENKIRNTANSLSNGKSGVSSVGTVVKNNGGEIKSHSFHGGNSFSPKISQMNRNHYALLCYQKYNINKSFEIFNTRIEDDVLFITGVIQPTPECDKYKIRIEYIPGLQPRVYVKSPDLPYTNDIHLYKEGFLCLFDPSETNWKDTNKLTEFTIPWTVEWIIYYELWKLSGQWEGKSSIH